MLTADENRLAAEQRVTNLYMNRRSMQIGLIRALGGRFDATQIGLTVPTDAPGEHASPTSPVAPAKPRRSEPEMSVKTNNIG